jgi:hypothetical protein
LALLARALSLSESSLARAGVLLPVLPAASCARWKSSMSAAALSSAACCATTAACTAGDTPACASDAPRKDPRCWRSACGRGAGGTAGDQVVAEPRAEPGTQQASQPCTPASARRIARLGHSAAAATRLLVCGAVRVGRRQQRPARPRARAPAVWCRPRPR